MLQHAVAAFLSAVILSPFSYYMGVSAGYFKLPQIIGYLISGIICGPFVLNILTTVHLKDLNIVEGACLAVIGLAAGSELHLHELHRIRKQVLAITLGVSGCTWLFIYCFLMWLGGRLKWALIEESDYPHLIAVATLSASLMMTRSPASAIAVLKEVEGKGPFCSLVMAVVVVKDVLVIIIFALNLEVIRAWLLATSSTSGSAGLSVYSVIMPVGSVLLSMGIGSIGGSLLGLVLRHHTSVLPRSMYLPQDRVKAVTVLLLATSIFYVSHVSQADGLLACVIMGLYISNRKTERLDKDKEEMHEILNLLMPLTNVAFFGLAGASLKLTSLAGSVWLALLVCAVRIVAVWCGSWLGCRVSGTVIEYRKTFWMTMITQAGVAMGLARVAGTRFPGWGLHFQTLMMAVIMINMFLGPPLFRFALIRAGEAKMAVSSPRDGTTTTAATDGSGTLNLKGRQSDDPLPPL